MRGRDLDHVSLVAGLAVMGLGLLLLGDQAGAFELGWNLLGAAIALTIGTILLVSGIKGGNAG